MNPRLKYSLPVAVLALLSSSCSDPAPTPAAVGLSLSIHSPGTPIVGTTCPVITTETIGNPPPTDREPGARLTDGEGANVTCSIAGNSVLGVSAKIAAGPVKFNISSGRIDPATGDGTFNVALFTPDSDSLNTDDEGGPCTFTAAPAPLQAKAGTLYAKFNCSSIWDRSNATPTACGANGVIVLEYCED